jgi:hypothetical protein
MSVIVPSTFAQALQPNIVAGIEHEVSPPPALRARRKMEIEIEAEGEGTFTITLEGASTTAKKGFAKDPFLSAVIGKGGWPLLQRELQAAVDGFPASAELRAGLDKIRSPKPGELDAVVDAVAKLKDACVKFDIKGAGKFALARGAVDEATRVLTVTLDAAEIDKVIAGAPLSSLKAQIGGDRGLLTAIGAALGPTLQRFR